MPEQQRLDDIRIVLINTSHTGNMGAAARAMKTMGLRNLIFVDPKQAPDGHASAMASGAGDVLANASIVDTMAEAIAGCRLVIGTSARSRTLQWPMLTAREAGTKLVSEVVNGPVALVFGRENNGLSNEELQLCHYHVCIDANPEYSSLNIAAAVQTLSYEIRMSWLATDNYPTPANNYPLVEDLERFYTHLESTLSNSGFIVKNHPGIVMSKLRRLFNRARPEAHELKILRGILSSIDKKIIPSKDTE